VNQALNMPYQVGLLRRHVHSSGCAPIHVRGQNVEPTYV